MWQRTKISSKDKSNHPGRESGESKSNQAIQAGNPGRESGECNSNQAARNM